jgi:hypothetical protein
MAKRTLDERVVVADTALETAIASMLSGDDGLTRVDALRLLSRRMLKKNTTNRVRLRTATN